jgi:hypothetical protein
VEENEPYINYCREHKTNLIDYALVAELLQEKFIRESSAQYQNKAKMQGVARLEMLLIKVQRVYRCTRRPNFVYLLCFSSPFFFTWPVGRPLVRLQVHRTTLNLHSARQPIKLSKTA